MQTLNPEQRAEATYEDVRRMYRDAARLNHRLEAMNIARRAAEAVTTALVDYVPEASRQKYATLGELHKRLDKLESLKRAGDLDVPRVVLAALRTLQAYGNYASHYEPSSHVPPIGATESALASLALVAHWFLSQSMTDESTKKAVTLREPNAPAPRLLERQRIWWRHRSLLDVPDLYSPSFFSLRVAGRDVAFDPNAPWRERLVQLSTYAERAASACEWICRVVIERESIFMLGDSASLDEMWLRFDQVSQQRPERIPPSIASDVAHVMKLRDGASHALSLGEKADNRLFAEAKRGKVRGIVAWFFDDYLGVSWFQSSRTFQMVFVCLVGLVAAAIYEHHTSPAAPTLADVEERYCEAPGPEVQEVCELIREVRRSQDGAHDPPPTEQY